MNMKNYNFSVLLDFYKDVLSTSQANCIDLYYNEDFSLSEIAEDIGITRQGVRDNIKRAEDILLQYEEKLGLAKRFSSLQSEISEITKKLEALKQKAIINNIKDISSDLDEIIKSAKNLSDF